MEEPFEREQEGAKAGLNPMFGDWQHRFKFAPVPYGDGGAKRAAFREKIQAELPNKFFFTGDVRLEIVLYLDVQTVLETSEFADLDNYAKCILDGLKGPDGILLDDTQVQSLTISWLDSFGRNDAHFDVSISGSPDDFMLKPVEFFEMPDKLWYPHSRTVWTDGKAEYQPDNSFYGGLLILEMLSSVKAKSRHKFRQAGMDRLRAYQSGMYLSSSAKGFHRGRVDTAFVKHGISEWRSAVETWKQSEAGAATAIEEILSGLKTAYETMSGLLMGEVPKKVV